MKAPQTGSKIVVEFGHPDEPRYHTTEATVEGVVYANQHGFKLYVVGPHFGMSVWDDQVEGTPNYDPTSPVRVHRLVTSQKGKQSS